MRLLWFILALEAVLFFSGLSFIARLDGAAQLLLILTLLALPIPWLVMLVGLFRSQSKQHRPKMAGVLLLAPLSLVLAAFLGGHIRSYLFYRDLPRMKEVVALIQDGSISLTHGRLNLPSRYGSLAYATHANRDAAGTLTVEFFVGGGFPVKHHAYLYLSDGVMTPEIRRDWPSGLRREKQWFEVSD